MTYLPLVRPPDLSESANKNLSFTNSFHLIITDWDSISVECCGNTGQQSSQLRAEAGVALVTPATRQLVRGKPALSC